MSAIHSDLTFVVRVGNMGGCGCAPVCPGAVHVFRSVWNRLVQQLFGQIPVGMNAEEQLPNIRIWRDEVVMVDDSYPYKFKVLSDEGDSPAPCDVVLYKGKYYVIGKVDDDVENVEESEPAGPEEPEPEAIEEP